MRVADNILRSSRQHSSHLLRITGTLMSLSLGVTSLAACFPITSTPSQASTPSASSLSTGGFWWWMHHSWRGVMCLGIGLIRVCVVMWWLVSRLRRWLGIWGAVVGR